MRPDVEVESDDFVVGVRQMAVRDAPEMSTATCDENAHVEDSAQRYRCLLRSARNGTTASPDDRDTPPSERESSPAAFAGLPTTDG